MDDAAAIEACYASKPLAEEMDGELVPLHDPAYVQTARLSLRIYD